MQREPILCERCGHVRLEGVECYTCQLFDRSKTLLREGEYVARRELIRELRDRVAKLSANADRLAKCGVNRGLYAETQTILTDVNLIVDMLKIGGSE